MARHIDPAKTSPKAASKEERLKQALKANLSRRKAQTRGRKAAQAEDSQAENKTNTQNNEA